MIGIPSASASHLGAFLARHPQLSNLNLSRSPDLFSKTGLRALTAGLGGVSLPGLKTLDLAGCNVQVDAAVDLGIFLARCSQLETLLLDDNEALFTRQGLDALGQGLGLKSPRALNKLYIAGCNIQPQAAPSLGTILARCSNLETLSLSMNPKLMTANGLAGLEQGLNGARLPVLQQVALYRCRVRGDESKDRIRQLLGAPETCTVRA
mmetsp:Transcript_13879/g.24206  ORF Transcript_13879/g.24206 Transcript_13879/m.24206 type:complete len:208 (+) Transcript_13879:32-655(+)